MFLVTAAEMRECDLRTIEDQHVQGQVLMERAARGLRRAILKRYDDLNRRRICIICGRGNNGGDGLLLARLFHDDGYNPRVFLTDPVSRISGDAALQVLQLVDRGVPLESLSPELLPWIAALSDRDIIVDAIVGTGFRGILAGPNALAVEAIEASRARVIAVDIPSGLSADSPLVPGPAVHAELTVTMGLPKRAFLFWPARTYVGEWVCVDIGIPPEVVTAVHPVASLIDGPSVSRAVPPIPPYAHKGTRGKVLIVGGSPGLTGAPCMVAMSAGRAGAGLIRVCVPRSLNVIIEEKLTEEMSLPLPETETGHISGSALDLLLSLAEDWDVLVIGPGMGRSPDSDRLVREVYARWPGQLLVDADGLNALALQGIPGRDPPLPPAVLTPHPGEMSRLSAHSPEEIAADPIGLATSFSQRNGVVLVLK
ncbi:MAG TPA: NAD(P)H-hydrate epimerase, partial [Syntrophales bacterium]